MRIALILFLILFIFFLVFLVLLQFSPEYVVETTRSHTFVVDADFVSVRRTLRKEDIMERVLAANDGEILEKKWVGMDFDLKHIFNRDLRAWTLNGTAYAKILIRDPDGGNMIVDLKQELLVKPDIIQAKISLDKPLKVGVSDVRQVIEITPHGEHQTQVTIDLYMRFSRKIPSFYHKYAYDRINQAADNQIRDIEPEFRKMIANQK